MLFLFSLLLTILILLLFRLFLPFLFPYCYDYSTIAGAQRGAVANPETTMSVLQCHRPWRPCTAFPGQLAEKLAIAGR